MDIHDGPTVREYTVYAYYNMYSALTYRVSGSVVQQGIWQSRKLTPQIVNCYTTYLFTDIFMLQD